LGRVLYHRYTDCAHGRRCNAAFCLHLLKIRAHRRLAICPFSLQPECPHVSKSICMLYLALRRTFLSLTSPGSDRRSTSISIMHVAQARRLHRKETSLNNVTEPPDHSVLALFPFWRRASAIRRPSHWSFTAVSTRQNDGDTVGLTSPGLVFRAAYFLPYENSGSP
jgi:hypothetical protein